MENSTRIRTFEFLDSRDSTIYSIAIHEILEADYGLYTWPCALILAQFIIHRRTSIKGKNVVELGAGTAVVGLVAARVGALSVTLTDHVEKHKTLVNCERAVALQSAGNARVCGLTWGHFSPQLTSLRGVDIIVASDCFYDTKDFEPVLITVAYLLEGNPTAEFWCTYQVRSADRSFEYLFEKWNLQCSHVALSEFCDDISVVSRDGSNIAPAHEIQMLIITSKAFAQDSVM